MDNKTLQIAELNLSVGHFSEILETLGLLEQLCRARMQIAEAQEMKASELVAVLKG
jgi:hypothetical protein